MGFDGVPSVVPCPRESLLDPHTLENTTCSRAGEVRHTVAGEMRHTNGSSVTESPSRAASCFRIAPSSRSGKLIQWSTTVPAGGVWCRRAAAAAAAPVAHFQPAVRRTGGRGF